MTYALTMSYEKATFCDITMSYDKTRIYDKTTFCDIIMTYDKTMNCNCCKIALNQHLNLPEILKPDFRLLTFDAKSFFTYLPEHTIYANFNIPVII